VKEAAEVQLNSPFDPAPFTIVGPPEDRGVIGQIQRSGGAYEPQVMQALSRILGPDSVAFNIGANIGVFALVMSRLSPRGRIFAFEPATETFDYLVKNLASNGAANVVAERRAVYDLTGPVPFVFSPAYPPGSFVSLSAQHAAESRPTEAVRLDDYVEAQGLGRVDLIMIDAEGAEFAVLRGAERTLAAHRPALLVEINPVSLRRVGGGTFRDLIAVLSTGRALFSITPDGTPARIVSERHAEKLLRREGVTEVLSLPRGHRARTSKTWVLGLRQRAALEARLNRRRPPPNEFVVEPSYRLGLPPGPITGVAGQVLVLPITVDNTSRSWFSSDFLYYPVHLSYRWLDADGNLVVAEGNRSGFSPPLGPGQSAVVKLAVALPAVAGEYRLVVTLLQENYVWFDELDPTLGTTVPVTVTG
jgi:FkbM family methyltransferase